MHAIHPLTDHSHHRMVSARLYLKLNDRRPTPQSRSTRRRTSGARLRQNDAPQLTHIALPYHAGVHFGYQGFILALPPL